MSEQKVLVEQFAMLDFDGLGPNKDSDLWDIPSEEFFDLLSNVMQNVFSLILNSPQCKSSDGTHVDEILFEHAVKACLHHDDGVGGNVSKVVVLTALQRMVLEVLKGINM